MANAMPNADASSLVLAALGLLPAKARRVWILSALAAPVMVEIPLGKFRGLEGDDRLAALAFEAEALTGLSAVETTLGARLARVDAEWEHWHAVQFERRVLQEMEAEVVRKGGRIAGVLHPGGVPVAFPEMPADDAEWARFEFWPETMITVRGGAGGCSVEVTHWDGHASVEEALKRALPGQALRRSCLLAPQAPVVRAPGVEVVPLGKPETLSSFFSAWAHVLLATEPEAPILRLPRPAMSAERRTGTMVIAALATAVLCAAHWGLTEWQLRRSTTELNELNARNKGRDDLQTAAAQIAKLRNDLAAARTAHQRELDGFSELLGALSELRPEGLVVRSLQNAGTQQNETVLTGLCQRPELAGQFAHALASRLQNFGWDVRPAKQKAQIAAGTAYWDFEIHLRPGAGASGLRTAGR
jgi:hypothetical protein